MAVVQATATLASSVCDGAPFSHKWSPSRPSRPIASFRVSARQRNSPPTKPRRTRRQKQPVDDGIRIQSPFLQGNVSSSNESGGRRRRNPELPQGVPLSESRTDRAAFVGWLVKLLRRNGDLSDWCGRVTAVTPPADCGATLLRVVGPAWNPLTLDREPHGERISVLLPLANDIIRTVDADNKNIYAQPPEGLLELSQRRMLLKWLDPQLEKLSQEMAPEAEKRMGLRPKMPTRKKLAEIGRRDLISAIEEAGGFLEVAFELNLRHRRKPSGYWDNMDTLDQEISRFIAANWVELHDVEDDSTYYYNQITGQVQIEEPQLPMVDASGENGSVWVIREEPSDRVMPSQKEIMSAGRYDLHHGIIYNGGYRAVSLELHRPPSYPRARTQSLRELAEELTKVMEEEGLEGRVPPPSLLCELGKQHLVRDINELGGYPTVVERMNAELGMNVRTRRRTGHWDDVEHLCAELREFMQLPGRGEEEMEGELHDCFLPTHKELIAQRRPDLRYGLQKHGQRKVAELLRVKINPRGRPVSS